MMPIKRSPFTSRSRARRRAATIPLVNPKRSVSPTDAMYMSISMVGSILEQLNKLINGPMAGADEFFKGYAKLAAKNLSDLLKQLSTRLQGTHQLDNVANAAVDLLDTLSEYDEASASELADALQDYAAQSDSNVMLEKLLSSKFVASMHDPLIEIVDGQLRIAGVLKIKGSNVTAEVELDETLPIQAFDPVLRSVK